MQATRLSNKRIVLTRAVAHIPALEQQARAAGAIPITFPCLAVEPMPDVILDAWSLLDQYSDVVFTSSNGVRAVVETLAENGYDATASLRGKRIAAVGQRTADCLKASGIQADIIPDNASQDGLIQAYAECGLPEKMLFFRAEQGREALIKAMLKQGVKVATIPAYRTTCPDGDASELVEMLKNDAVDAVLLGSAKVAGFYIRRVGSVELANRPVIVAISEKLAGAARQMGLDVQVVAKHASFEAMLEALADYFERQ